MSLPFRLRQAAGSRSGRRPPGPRRKEAMTIPEVQRVRDQRIDAIVPLMSPALLHHELPLTADLHDTVLDSRRQVVDVLDGRDPRLLVVVGPCSVHDPVAAGEYADRLRAEAGRLADDLLVVMRVYFEKPRSTVGWKGLINDPNLDGSFQINDGLRVGRNLLLELNEFGVPSGCEFLAMITPQYLADLVSWGAIGARTTESQVHRELASGLSCPVGFKNGTDGNVRIVLDAIRAAHALHHFLSVTKADHSAIVSTAGNDDCHIIWRGGCSGFLFSGGRTLIFRPGSHFRTDHWDLFAGHLQDFFMVGAWWQR